MTTQTQKHRWRRTTPRSRRSMPRCGRSATTPPSLASSSRSSAASSSRPARSAPASGARRRCGHGQRRHPGGAGGRRGRRVRPRPGAARRRSRSSPMTRSVSTSSGARADAEALPFEDASFDVVTSCVGVMFAPHHQPAADELVRVLRPGGRLGLVSWTPAGFIGQMFATMKPYAAPPPPGAQPPPLWGDEAHVLALLGDRVGRGREREAHRCGRISPGRRTSATSSSAPTARRSSPTAASLTTPTGSQPSMRPWSGSPVTTWTSAAGCRGSTCCSPPDRARSERHRPRRRRPARECRTPPCPPTPLSYPLGI